MEPSEVARALWHRFQDHNWTGAAELIAENAVIEWPASRERLVGRDNIIAVNREYPEGWSIKVLRVVAEDDQVVAEVEVPHTELGLFRVAVVLHGAGRPDHARHRVLDDGRRRRAASDRAHLVERY